MLVWKSLIFNKVANRNIFLPNSKWVFLLIFYRIVVGALVENKAWFCLCLQDLLLYHSLFLTLNFGRSFSTLFLLSCFIKVSHLGASKQGFFSNCSVNLPYHNMEFPINSQNTFNPREFCNPLRLEFPYVIMTSTSEVDAWTTNQGLILYQVNHSRGNTKGEPLFTKKGGITNIIVRNKLKSW
jgi:hypothetical protein